MQVDYIIVGNGLAGACLALQLHRMGKKLMVFDDPAANQSSTVAAGLFNPVTGKMMKKTWQADVLFPCLNSFYRQAEHLLERTFFHPAGIYRPFLSAGEQNEWMALTLAADQEMEVVLEPRFGAQVYDPFGGLLLHRAGFIQVSALLDGVRGLLVRAHQYVEEPFDYSQVTLDTGQVQYGSIVARKIIFCEGLGARNNPWLLPLPIHPLKGEVLIVETDLPPAPVINRGVYLVPQPQPGLFRAGATYDPHDNTRAPTAKGRHDLERQITALIKIPFRVVGHEWGFRPTVPDRRPIVGPHPRFEQIIVFNGLGTKGVSLAPFFSGLLARWLAGKETLPPDASMNRFYPLYSN